MDGRPAPPTARQEQETLPMTFRSRTNHPGSLEDRMTRRVAIRGASILGINALLESQGVYWAFAQEDTPATGLAGIYPEVAITAADFSFAMPATTPAGLTSVLFRNEGHVGHHAMFLRLNDDADFSDFEAALTRSDPGPALALSQSLGGPVADPGLEASVIVDLLPGQYMVICAIPEADGTPHYMLGMQAPLEVTEPAANAAPPDAAVTVDMVDFAYGMPDMAIAAGPQIWTAPNAGEQIHELAIMRLAPGITFEQVQTMLSAEAIATPAMASPAAGEMAAPPIEVIGGVAPMSPGYTNWPVLDLAPGDYTAICFVPDAETGAPHVALGMIMPFTLS
jgi:hypothetical protein